MPRNDAESSDRTVLTGQDAVEFLRILENTEPPAGIERLREHFGKVQLPDERPWEPKFSQQEAQ